jgi:hypothetical protein
VRVAGPYGEAAARRSGTLPRMRTTTALLVLLEVALPAVALPHPCEVEVAQMQKNLNSIRGAIDTIEGLRPSDNQRQVLAAAKGKYESELLRTTEAQGRCELLVRAESPDATPSPPSSAAPSAATPAATPATPETAPPTTTAAPASPVAAPVPAGPAPAAVAPVPTAVPSGPAPAAAPPMATAPCLTGCGKDTDCKGERICVKGDCVDPPAKGSPTR